MPTDNDFPICTFSAGLDWKIQPWVMTGFTTGNPVINYKYREVKYNTKGKKTLFFITSDRQP